MITELTQTTASAIAQAIRTAHARTGNSAMAFTLVVPTDEKHYKHVFSACLQAGGEHPSRIIVVVLSPGGESRLDAKIRTGEGVPGDIITLRMHGELAEHAASVVLPLLLPDSQVVAWWPGPSPENLADDPIGRLATRRITDAAGAAEPVEALLVRARHHSPGDTDLTWTRLTPWRALLAAALDQYPGRVRRATVEGSRANAPAELMAAWLQGRLDVDVERVATRGPGITGVRLTTAAGDVAILRPGTAATASYLVPGQPERHVALERRDINELITEELRRMDADQVFEEATRTLLERDRRHLVDRTAPKRRGTSPGTRSSSTRRTGGQE